MEMLKLVFYEDIISKLPKNSIFLAGPTSRANVFEKSWRNEAVKFLENFNFNGTVFIPEFSKPKQFTNNDWSQSTAWEKEFMDSATCILFWVPRKIPNMLGLTTNLEFGYYIAKRPENIILGYPKDADEVEWMTIKYKECHPKSFHNPTNTLEETVLNAIKVANKGGIYYL